MMDTRNSITPVESPHTKQEASPLPALLLPLSARSIAVSPSYFKTVPLRLRLKTRLKIRNRSGSGSVSISGSGSNSFKGALLPNSNTLAYPELLIKGV